MGVGGREVERSGTAREQYQLAVNIKKIVLAMSGQLTLWMEDVDLQIPKAERLVGIS